MLLAASTFAPELVEAAIKVHRAALDLIPQLDGNGRQIESHFSYRLIVADPDDAKFADCATAAETDYIVRKNGEATS